MEFLTLIIGNENCFGDPNGKELRHNLLLAIGTTPTPPFPYVHNVKYKYERAISSACKIIRCGKFHCGFIESPV